MESLGRASKHLIREWPTLAGCRGHLTAPRKKKVRPVSERRKNNQEKNLRLERLNSERKKEFFHGFSGSQNFSN